MVKAPEAVGDVSLNEPGCPGPVIDHFGQGSVAAPAGTETVGPARELGLVICLQQEAHYFAGGGIVADSDPEAELEETRWKGTQIERLVARSPSAFPAASGPPRTG